MDNIVITVNATVSSSILVSSFYLSSISIRIYSYLTLNFHNSPSSFHPCFLTFNKVKRISITKIILLYYIYEKIFSFPSSTFLIFLHEKIYSFEKQIRKSSSLIGEEEIDTINNSVIVDHSDHFLDDTLGQALGQAWFDTPSPPVRLISNICMPIQG